MRNIFEREVWESGKKEAYIVRRLIGEVMLLNGFLLKLKSWIILGATI